MIYLSTHKIQDQQDYIINASINSKFPHILELQKLPEFLKLINYLNLTTYYDRIERMQ